MPNSVRAKTALAPKTIFIGGIILLLFALLINPTIRQEYECLNFHTPVDETLTVGSNKVEVGTVKTEAEREQGLSGRPCIKNDQAMLFIFPANDNLNHCFWMKGMRFPIDMVWVNSSKRVVKVESAVAPETFPKIFCPNQPSQYVLELKAHEASRLGLDVGTIVYF